MCKIASEIVQKFIIWTDAISYGQEIFKTRTIVSSPSDSASCSQGPRIEGQN